MRVIYMKRSLLLTLLATSALISLLYVIDFYFFQQRQVPPVSLTLNSSSSLLLSKVVLQSKPGDRLLPPTTTPPSKRKCSVSLVVILCEDAAEGSGVAGDFGRQMRQTLVLLKSVALQTHLGSDVPPHMRNCVRVFILGDKRGSFEELRGRVEAEWAEEFRARLQLVFLPVSYPHGSEWMRRMFRPCATLRLFIPDIFAQRRSEGEEEEEEEEEEELLVYVDTDFIFLRSVQSLVVDYFGGGKAGAKVVAGMAPCLFHYGTASSKIPYFGNSGLNAGLMVMNVGRMVAMGWTRKMRLVTALFRSAISLADQDILNIYFHFFPEELTLLGCDWNFRPFQCRPGSTCAAAAAKGISALHGNALSFTPSGREPMFEAVFRVFHGHLRLDGNFSVEEFVEVLETELEEVEERGGGKSECVEFGGFRGMVLGGLESLETPVEVEIVTEDVEMWES